MYSGGGTENMAVVVQNHFYYTEDVSMSCSCNPNKSIKCTVTQCKNHCKDEDYCSLSSIAVGTHESNPTMIECTDCTSFELK